MKPWYRAVRLPGGDWTLADGRSGEVFHPILGAEQEAEMLYVGPSGLREALGRELKEPLVVWDLGLGAAGNAAAVLACWRQYGRRPLELWSFDRDREALWAARGFRAERGEGFGWLVGLPEVLFTGGEVIEMENGRGVRGIWRVWEGDFVDWVASQGTGEHHPFLVMVDWYSPEVSIREWTLEHWRGLFCLLSADAETRLLFHSRSTAVRVTLLLAGFWVGMGPKLGAKEETTLAAMGPGVVSQPLGKRFLEKVRRSTNAAPFRAGGTDQRGPIGAEDWTKVLGHPQFADVFPG